MCSPADFANHVRGRTGGLIQTNYQTFGIPQGTPVSGLYANIYLRTFDREMSAWCSQHGGSYRRYSDDIAVVLPSGAKVLHVVAVAEKLLADYGLAMSVDKTDTANFKGGLLVSANPIQYLEFTFDGHKTLIRASSLDAYRGKMRRGIHAKMIAAKSKKCYLWKCTSAKALVVTLTLESDETSCDTPTKPQTSWAVPKSDNRWRAM